MNKLIPIVALFFFSTKLLSAQSASKITFFDWDSIHSQVDLYKTNELEIARFKAFIQEKDSLKIIQFQTNYHRLLDIYERHSCSQLPNKIDTLKAELENEKNKIEKFEELMPKIINEFEAKSKEWADDFFKLKVRYYADLQGFKAVYGINKLLFDRDDFSKKIIELINKDENAKEAQLYFLKFLNNKIKFYYNLE